jgi:hypothetical protein
LDDGPPIFNQDYTCPGLLVRVLSSLSTCRVRDFHPLRSTFPSCSTSLDNKSHQALPRSLAATQRISIDFFSFGYLDVSVPQVRFCNLCIQLQMTVLTHYRVPPFGHLWFNACFQLTKAFRRIPRPSSPLTAKASTVCASLLDHIISVTFYVDFFLYSSMRVLSRSVTYLCMPPHLLALAPRLKIKLSQKHDYMFCFHFYSLEFACVTSFFTQFFNERLALPD